jgi:hypothetical protein
LAFTPAATDTAFLRLAEITTGNTMAAGTERWYGICKTVI